MIFHHIAAGTQMIKAQIFLPKIYYTYRLALKPKRDIIGARKHSTNASSTSDAPTANATPENYSTSSLLNDSRSVGFHKPSAISRNSNARSSNSDYLLQLISKLTLIDKTIRTRKVELLRRKSAAKQLKDIIRDGIEKTVDVWLLVHMLIDAYV